MAKGKKRPAELPEYGTVMMKGVQYYRTRITDADGKRVAIYGLTREELYDRVEDAQKKIAEVVFHRENPTVEAKPVIIAHTTGNRRFLQHLVALHPFHIIYGL